jgi:CheY-like chemotaxis protein
MPVRAASPAAPHTTVLVVEDETLIRMLAADSLEDSGYNVLEAADAAEALRILEEHDEVAVLFTDVNMPGPMDGLALAGLMHDRRPDLGLIITSGRGTPDLARLPQSSIYLAKPYGPQQLAAAVEKQTLH